MEKGIIVFMGQKEAKQEREREKWIREELILRERIENC
jgi:hypothetical protein